MDKHDTLLLTSDSAENRSLLRGALGESFNLLEAANAQQALLLLKQNISCVASILIDISQNNMIDSSYAPIVEKIPVILICGEESSDLLNRGFDFGAADVIPLDYDPTAMHHRIENIVQLHLHKQHLEAMVAEQAEHLRHANDTMVDALSSIIEYRSVESGQHILRIRHFTKILLEEVRRSCPEYQLTDEVISIISSASALHDVGKIAIPDSILMKPGRLTVEERAVMETHALTGCHILDSLGDMGNEEYLRYAHNICHFHHERWDGGGYPEGLKGDDIPICAQVVGLADVYDALTSKRVYKDAYSFETAVNMILRGECGAFSPKLLECFKHVLTQFEALARAYADGLAPKTEKFDVTLPGPVQQEETDTLNRVQGKYQCLLHYINCFVLELSVDQGHFHLRYNPYPEFAMIGQASSFTEISDMVLNRLVVPEDRQRMHDLIHTGIEEYLRSGMRRQSFLFRFFGRNGEVLPCDVTLLRANVNQKANRSLAVLCRKLAPGQENTVFPPSNQESIVYTLAESTYCCRNDRDFTLVQAGRDTHSLAGYPLEEFRERFHDRLIELVYPEDRELVRSTFREQLSRGTGVQMEFRVVRKDGQIEWVANKSRLVVDHDGQEYLYSFLTDISHYQTAYDALSARLKRYEIILAQTENVLFDWDLQTDTISFSDTWEKIFGFLPATDNAHLLLSAASHFHPDDLPLLLDRLSNLENGSHYEMVEVRIATAKGRYLWCRFRASALRDEKGNLEKICGIIINIDAEKQAEQALQERAERDPLTKMLNKHAGRKQAEEYFSRYPQGVECAMLIIDLDNFKQVNDKFGHLFGDTVLTHAARDIRKIFRSQDIVARIGGDEFMVLMRGVSDRRLLESRCQRLISIFRNFSQNYRQKLSLGCSIGIALSPEHGSSYFSLYQHADQALYRAKALGKGGFVFYSPQDTAYYTQHQAVSLNTPIDSDSEPGLADSSLVQYVFQRLYSSHNVAESVNEILGLVGRKLNVSRVYVFENSDDNRFCSNTYEWCNDGIQPEIQNLQNISYETDIPHYEDNFNEQGIFYCPDISTLPQSAYDIVAPQGIKSMLHCAIREGGVFRGYIGFDECVEQRLWTSEQIDLLVYFSEMLSVFLLKKREQEKALKQADEFSTILDNQNAWIYIVDPETWELKYLNAKLKSHIPGIRSGMLCYKALKGLDCRCANCPVDHLPETGTASTIGCDERHHFHVLTEASRVRLNDADTCLITCRELPDPQKLCNPSVLPENVTENVTAPV